MFIYLQNNVAFSSNLSQHQHPPYLSVMLWLSWEISGSAVISDHPARIICIVCPVTIVRTSDVWWPWDPVCQVEEAEDNKIKMWLQMLRCSLSSLTSLSPLCLMFGRSGREVMMVSNTTTMSDLCRQYFIIIWFIWFFARMSHHWSRVIKVMMRKVGERKRGYIYSLTFYCQHNSLIYSSKGGNLMKKVLQMLPNCSTKYLIRLIPGSICTNVTLDHSSGLMWPRKS